MSTTTARDPPHAGTAGGGQVRKRLEAEPELLACGPQAVLYALLG